MTAEVALDVIALTCRYQNQLIIDRASLRVPGGEIVAIVGPSGIGKSTFLSAIAGLTEIQSGHVLVDGVDVTAQPPYLRRCGLVFQDPLLFTHLDVCDNVAYGPRRHGVSKKAAREYANQLLRWAGAGELAQRNVATLSGGQAQRVALVRAIAAQPRVLLLDEPFSALDTEVRQRMVTQVRGMIEGSGLAAVHVTHDLGEAHAMADRVVGLTDLFDAR